MNTVFIVSNVLSIIEKVLPPRPRFQLLLVKIDRWRTFEHGYHLLPALVDPERCAIDVGANLGYYSAKMARYTSRMHCFEPIPWMADDLEKKLPRRVVLHRAAVSDHQGTATLRIPYRGQTALHGTATIEPEIALRDAEHIEELQCRVIPLDGTIQEPVGLIKIDVEGHELAVLNGATRLIEQHAPIVMLESERRHHPQSPDKIFEYFRERGYIGTALMKKRIFALENFSLDIHQCRNRKGRHYVNCFIFFPSLTSD